VTRISVIAAAAGVVIGAAGVGLAWAISGGSSGASHDKRPLAAPAALGAYQALGTVEARHGATGKANALREIAWNEKSAAFLSAAYGGAPSLVAKYADTGLDTFVTLFAVRAPSPRPFYEYQDAAYLGLARPTNEVRPEGDDTCGLQNEPTPPGQTPKPETVFVVTCQRSDAKLTVFIHVGGGNLEHDPARVAALVDSAWQSLAS